MKVGGSAPGSEGLGPRHSVAPVCGGTAHRGRPTPSLRLAIPPGPGRARDRLARQRASQAFRDDGQVLWSTHRRGNPVGGTISERHGRPARARSSGREGLGYMVKGILALAVVAAAIAFGVRWITHEGTSQGPATVRVEVPNPMGDDDGGGDGGQILVP